MSMISRQYKAVKAVLCGLCGQTDKAGQLRKELRAEVRQIKHKQREDVAAALMRQAIAKAMVGDANATAPRLLIQESRLASLAIKQRQANIPRML